METEQGRLPPPPSPIASLASGFDAVASRITVILLPALLDLFLWLGPRLRLKRFLQPFIDRFPEYYTSFSSNLPDLATIQTIWKTIAENFNLFIVLRTFPVGVTSLMWRLSLSSTNTPYGPPITIDAGSFFSIAGWLLLIVLTGWALGGLYFQWVSRVALKPVQPRPLRQSMAQSLILSLTWAGLLFLLGMPVLTIMTVTQFFSPFIGQAVLFILTLFAIWIAVPVFFSAHGIFTLQLDALRAILNSLRMARFTLPNTGMFLLAVVVISQGLDFLWRMPPEDSWLTLVGIAGHAFVSTALLAASFIYYRDINTWLNVIFEKLKTQTTSARV